ncbi:MAG TPA: DUF4124 domain-containing protein [Myxococcaceae bacterium]|nr:DUF4124 domain-containing protein [Myxococcaceae bacterium]
MSRSPLRLALLGLALHSAAALADDVYVWMDPSGETHYTNDVATIPERSRRTARKLDVEASSEPKATAKADDAAPKSGSSPKDSLPVADSSQPPPPEPIETALLVPREDEKVSEEQWRTLFRKANERVKRAERKAQRSRDALAKLPGQDITTYDVAGNVVVESRYQTLRVQVDEDEYQLQVAQEQLHDLERAAAREAIPLEWRR